MPKVVVDDGALRREALQICLQLPQDSSEALIVLRYAEELVRGFLAGPRPADSVVELKGRLTGLASGARRPGSLGLFDRVDGQRDLDRHVIPGAAEDPI